MRTPARSAVRALLVATALLVAPAATFAADLAIVGARILTSPDDPPIDEGTVVVRDGRIAPGEPGDLVLLCSDPARDVDASADVRYTIRDGKVIFGY